MVPVSVCAAPPARRGYEQPLSPGRHGSLRRQGQRRHRPVQQAQQQRRRPQHIPGICNHGVSIVCEGWLLPLVCVGRRPLTFAKWALGRIYYACGVSWYLVGSGRLYLSIPK